MKILLAEDDLITSEIIKEQLQQWKYDVTCAYNGTEAWGALQGEDAPKLAILDWQMPEMTGLEICQKLRSLKSGSYVYVIMLTGLSEKMYIVQGLEAGADDYLSKPCNPQELKVRLMTGQRILSMEAEMLFLMKQMQDCAFTEKSTIYDAKLISRELEILRLVSAGKSNEEIALAFHLSPDWVMAHLSNIMQKMGVKSREEAAQKAIKDGFFKSDVLI
jgi:DNA-binding NarL/FixJ family response regulator